MANDERTRLFEENIKLAYMLVNKQFDWAYRNGYSEKQDVEQVALIGLWRAAGAYDPARGFAFSTLAAHCIRNEVAQLVRRAKKHMGNAHLEDILIDDGEGSILTGRDLLADKRSDMDDVLATPLEVTLERIRGMRNGEQLVDIVKMRLEGKTERQIGEALGLGQATVSKYLKLVKPCFLDNESKKYNNKR